MRKIFTLFFCAASLATGLAQQESYFTNPVIHGDVADPSIIRIDQTYYITGTSSEWAPYYPVFTSTDLVNWQQTGHVFDEKPEWCSFLEVWVLGESSTNLALANLVAAS